MPVDDNKNYTSRCILFGKKIFPKRCFFRIEVEEGKVRVRSESSKRKEQAARGDVYVSRTFRCRGAFLERSLMPTLPLIITLMHNAASLLFTLSRRSCDPHDLQAYCRDGGTYAAVGAVRLCRCIVFFPSQELSIRQIHSYSST